MFPDGRDERNISGENENIWKNIPGEKLPKFAGRNGGNILLAGFNGWEQLGGRWKEMTPVWTIFPRGIYPLASGFKT